MEKRIEILEKYDKIQDYTMGAGYTVEDTMCAMDAYAKHCQSEADREIERLKAKYKKLESRAMVLADCLESGINGINWYVENSPESNNCDLEWLTKANVNLQAYRKEAKDGE